MVPVQESLSSGAQREALAVLLAHICEHFSVPVEEQAGVIETRSLLIGEAPTLLEIDEGSGYLKIFIEVGRPAEADAARLHHHLLTLHLMEPAPFFLVAGVDAISGSVVLYAYSPVPLDAQSQDDFVVFLEDCVEIRDSLRADVSFQFPPQA